MDTYLVKGVFCGQNGYSSFSISNSTSDKHVKYTMIFWNHEKKPGYSYSAAMYSNNFTHFDSSVKFNIVESEKRVKGYFIELRQVYIELFKKYAKTNHHMIFRCHNKKKPQQIEGQNWIIPKPEERTTHFITNDDECRKYLCQMEFKSFIFPFAIIGKHWQPLKSRGSTFMMGMFLILVQLILEMIPLFYSISFGFYNDLYIFALFALPIEVNIKLLIVFNCLQMVFFLFIQRYYKLSSKNSGLVVFILRGFKIAFQSYIGVIITIFISHLIQFIGFFFLIAFSSNFKFKVTTNILTMFQIIGTIVDYAFYLIVLMIAIVDFFINFRLKQWKSFWFRHDPFFFRIQSLFIIPMIITQIWYDFLGSGFWSYNAECFNEDRTLSIAKAIIYFFEKVSYMVYFSGIVIVISYFKKIKSCFHQKQKPITDQLDEIFSDPELNELFINFSQNEFSIENVLVYQEIKEFRQMSDKQRCKNASKIYLKYLNGEYSELEVNVPRRLTKKVKAFLDTDKVPEVDLFDEILIVVRENLSDTFSRFILSEELIRYQDTRKLVMENTKLLNNDY
eukprot:gene9589-1791_t